MEPRDRAAMLAFVRAHHVHYEVQPEEVGEGSRRELVGVRLRLLAAHERGKLEAPGCPACVELLRDMRSFADRLAAEAGLGDRAEVIPASRKLYQSAEDRDVDEVAVTLRIRCDAPEDRRPGAGQERCLAGLQQRLAELGASH
jgi:hypothetical protein